MAGFSQAEPVKQQSLVPGLYVYMRPGSLK
jgi:hypothetical protein